MTPQLYIITDGTRDRFFSDLSQTIITRFLNRARLFTNRKEAERLCRIYNRTRVEWFVVPVDITIRKA